MKITSVLLSIGILFAFWACSENPQSPTNYSNSETLQKQGKGNIGINILLNTNVTDDILADLDNHGKVFNVLYKINAVILKAKADELEAIQALPYVELATPDAERNAPPIDSVPVTDFEVGLSTWNLDAINVTAGPGLTTRAVSEDGSGVYVGVLDTGLLDSWRQYFPQERIAVEYATSFTGGGAAGNNAAEQPNKWEHDQNSHGTHVTSTIIGYSLGGTPVTGVAPMATIIPIKVLNQSGGGWSSAIAAGIMRIAELKEGPLAGSPVVINMSLGGPNLDAVEKAAIDYAIAAGVIICASAGNNGTAGMGYPGAYEPVISAAAAGWNYEFSIGPWWYALDVAEPTNTDDFYIADFSSRELMGQHLDVTAPGSYVVGPYQLNSGANKLSYYYLSGTSMASPHVAGTVALMAQKYNSLTASDAESILEGSAISMPAYTSADRGAGLLDAAAALANTP